MLVGHERGPTRRRRNSRSANAKKPTDAVGRRPSAREPPIRARGAPHTSRVEGAGLVALVGVLAHAEMDAEIETAMPMNRNAKATEIG